MDVDERVPTASGDSPEGKILNPDTLEFHGPHGWLRIFCVVVDKSKSKLAAQGAQHLRYAVGGHGFSGASDSFVPEADLQAFCRELVRLADGEDAEAHLEGHETGGLDIRLKPGPEPGTISIEGRIAQNNYRTLDEKDGLYIWSTQFGFWVQRDHFPLVQKVKWVVHFTS